MKKLTPEQVKRIQTDLDEFCADALNRTNKFDGQTLTLEHYASFEAVVDAARFTRALTMGTHPDSDVITLTLAALWKENQRLKSLNDEYDEMTRRLIKEADICATDFIGDSKLYAFIVVADMTPEERTDMLAGYGPAKEPPCPTPTTK